MRLLIILAGASKHDPALVMPCEGYQFLFDTVSNRHLLDGGPLTLERFNSAAADLAGRFDPDRSKYRITPQVEEPGEVPATASQCEAWATERAELLAQIETLKKPRIPMPAKLTKPAPAPALATA